FYDHLVHQPRSVRKPGGAAPDASTAKAPQSPEDTQQSRRDHAIAIVVDTFEALLSERGDSDKIWASTLKQAIKRRRPDFNESYYGFKAFGSVLDEAQAQGLLDVGRDEKSGAFVSRPAAPAEPPRKGRKASKAVKNAAAAPAPVKAARKPAAKKPRSGQ